MGRFEIRYVVSISVLGCTLYMWLFLQKRSMICCYPFCEITTGITKMYPSVLASLEMALLSNLDIEINDARAARNVV